MPNRVLRDWTTSEVIDQLTPAAEVFFTRLLMKADDFGNYTANAKLLNAALFPLRKYPLSKIDTWVNECVVCGVLTSYEVDGKRFLNIPNFGQRLRTMTGKYPLPTNGSNPPSIDRKSPPEGETKGNEVETREKGKAYGLTHDNFVIVKPKYATDKLCRINGKAGLIEYMEANQTVLNMPEHGEKFMRWAKGKVFNELSHVQNTYTKYIEKQYQ